MKVRENIDHFGLRSVVAAATLTGGVRVSLAAKPNYDKNAYLESSSFIINISGDTPDVGYWGASIPVINGELPYDLISHGHVDSALQKRGKDRFLEVLPEIKPLLEEFKEEVIIRITAHMVGKIA